MTQSFASHAEAVAHAERTIGLFWTQTHYVGALPGGRHFLRALNVPKANSTRIRLITQGLLHPSTPELELKRKRENADFIGWHAIMRERRDAERHQHS